MYQQKSFEQQLSGTLYLVPTPIGNLDDMTFRAVETLKSVDLILAEDTRHTQKLLNHFDIHTKQLSFHEHNSKERIAYVIELLRTGKSLAQVSDAGTPSISDPGEDLVSVCVLERLPVVSLPGANAGITALIASGLVPQPFYFHGFLPRKKREQIETLQVLGQKSETMIFYESPNRLKQTLTNMSSVFDAKRSVVVCRELTKKYEEYIRGTLEQVCHWAQDTDIKGEICLLVSGLTSDEQLAIDNQDADQLAHMSIVERVDYEMTQNNLVSKEAIKKVAKAMRLDKRDVYRMYHEGE